MTVEQLAENPEIVRWVTNTFAAQKMPRPWNPEHIRDWARRGGPDYVCGLYERRDLSVEELESLLDLAMGLA